MILSFSLLGWLAAEVILQLRQYFRGDSAKTIEWNSLAFVTVTAVGAGFLAGVAGRFTHALDLPIRGLGWYITVLVIVWVGVGLRLWSIIVLGKYFRCVVHIQEGHRVVRHGPYRVLRHPSYAGMLLALFGLSLTFANLASMVVYNLFLFVGVRYRIHVEERVLSTGLGEEYVDYMRETNRLIPGVW